MIPTVQMFVPKFGRVVIVNAADEAAFRETYGARYPDEPEPTHEEAQGSEGNEEVLKDAPASAKKAKVAKQSNPVE